MALISSVFFLIKRSSLNGIIEDKIKIGVVYDNIDNN